MKEKDVTLEQFLEAKKAEDLLEGLGFESGLKLLEGLVTKVESGGLPLERSMQAYERGVLLTGHLRGLISGAEAKLKLLQQKAAAEK